MSGYYFPMWSPGRTIGEWRIEGQSCTAGHVQRTINVHCLILSRTLPIVT
jgi:hypothetical protein